MMEIKSILPISADDLAKIYAEAPRARIDKFVGDLNKYMAKYQIVSAKQVAMFLAQIGHESGQLRYTEEIASGAAYDTGRLAVKLGNTPAKDKDGQKYKGRGLIQITGRYNYRELNKAMKYPNVDLEVNPESLAELPLCVESACWFWWKGGMNYMAEQDMFERVTRAINGGLNGIADRRMLWERGKKVFKLQE